jgi:hypothetical protein
VGLRTLLDRNSSDVALLVGNGVNLFDQAAGCADWPELLETLATEHLAEHHAIPAGISLPEFYDVLDVGAGRRTRGSLQREFCELMDRWCPADQHKRIVGWARRNAVPLLTTNFDDLLVQAGGLRQYTLFEPTDAVKAPTDYYPWETYFAQAELTEPCSGFGVWQLHGMRQYYRSVRLGLTHYMGSVERARRWIYRRKQTRMLDPGVSWRGQKTWLQVFLTKPLIIFGLGLHENEVFIRWLLIERARLFNKYPKYRKPAWYIVCEAAASADDPGKLFFLRSMGVEPIHVPSFDQIYGAAIWS